MHFQQPLPGNLGAVGGLGGLPLQGPPLSNFAIPGSGEGGAFGTPGGSAPGGSVDLPSATAYAELPPLDQIDGGIVLGEVLGIDTTFEFTSSQKALEARPGRKFFGYSVKETSTTDSAKAVVRRGVGSSGPPLAYINVAAGQTAADVFERGLACAEGLYFELLSGAMTIVLYYSGGPE